MYLNKVMKKFEIVCRTHNLLDEEIVIKAISLTPKEAIGSPCRRDFPIIKGKERLMEASFKESKGQAYTDMIGNYEGSLKDILVLPLKNNYERAVLIATINAVYKYLGLCEHTVHCKDEEPEKCAMKLIDYIRDHYGLVKIMLVGMQPAMLDYLSRKFEVRVIDMQNDIIGTDKYGVIVESPYYTEEVMAWCDLVIATGSTSTNDSLSKFLDQKPVIFYGTTVAGIAVINHLDRFCPYSI